MLCRAKKHAFAFQKQKRYWALSIRHSIIHSLLMISPKQASKLFIKSYQIQECSVNCIKWHSFRIFSVLKPVSASNQPVILLVASQDRQKRQLIVESGFGHGSDSVTSKSILCPSETSGSRLTIPGSRLESKQVQHARAKRLFYTVKTGNEQRSTGDRKSGGRAGG